MKKTTAFILLLTQFPTLGFGSENYRVLGAGVKNRDNGHLLQLACLGEKSDSGEVGCERVQFLLSKNSGESVLVGPVLPISSSSSEEVKKFVKTLRDANRADVIEGRNIDLFSWTNSIGTVGSVGGVALGLGALALVAGGGVVIAGAAVAGFGITLIVDVIRAPFRMKERILTGEAFISREVIDPSGALQARDREYWQLKGKKISSGDFRRLYKAIASDDREYINEAETTCVLKEVRVVSKDPDGYFGSNLTGIAAQLRHQVGSRDVEAAEGALSEDVRYMLRDRYYSIPGAKNGFSAIVEMDERGFGGFVGTTNSRYCYRARFLDSSGKQIWSEGKHCDNLRNGLTEMARKFPSCHRLNFF